MWQDKQQRGRLVGGVVLILLGIMALVTNTIEESIEDWLWIVFLAGAAVFFGWVHVTSKEVWAAIAACVAAAIAVLVFLLTQINPTGIGVPMLVLPVTAVPFVCLWWRDRRQWGLLIPAYVMAAVALGLPLAEQTGKMIPAYVMAVIGVPFVVAAVLTRKWAFLIPGGTRFLVGLIVLVMAAGAPETVVTALIALVLMGGGGFILLRGQFVQ